MWAAKIERRRLLASHLEKDEVVRWDARSTCLEAPASHQSLLGDGQLLVTAQRLIFWPDSHAFISLPFREIAAAEGKKLGRGSSDLAIGMKSRDRWLFDTSSVVAKSARKYLRKSAG
jgi:hypothetical protein